jgi:hypothetical protein
MTQAADAKQLPSWLKETEQGMSITLKYKSTVNGITVDKLSMRAPSIKDNRTAKDLAGGDNEKHELNLFATLTEAHVNDIEALKERDYRRLQEGYFRLVSEDEL